MRDVPVHVALEELVSLTGISLVYSSEVVKDRRTVCREDDVAAEVLLRCIVSGAALDFYQLSSGTYVVIADPESAPAYGTISGQVLDAITGDPVPLARVETVGGERRALTDGRGIFVIPRMLPGAHQLSVTGFGYSPARLSIELGASSMVRREVQLEPGAIELGPVVVDGLQAGGGRSWADGITDGNEVTPSSIDRAVALRSSVGLARRPLFSELSVQGGAPGEHIVRLDGAPVYDPVSLGRSRSAFSPLALRRIEVRKAGFGVEGGSYSAGLVDVEQATADPTGPGGATAFVDSWGSNASVSLPIFAFGGEGSLMVTGRRSNWDVFREPALDQAIQDWNQVDPILMGSLLGDAGQTGDLLPYTLHGHGADVAYSDVHAALRLALPGFRSIRASVYRGTNDFSSELFASGAPAGSDVLDRLVVVGEAYDWSNTVAQLRADWLVGARTSMQARTWYSAHELLHDYAMVDGAEVGYDPLTSDVAVVESALQSRLAARPATGEGNRIEEFGTALTGDIVLGPENRLSAGVEVVRVSSRAHLDNNLIASLATEVEGWRGAAYVGNEWRVAPNVSIEGGLRGTSVQGVGSFLEPRGAIRIDGGVSTDTPWSLRLSGGLYRQFVHQFDLTNVGPSALVPSIRFWVPSDGTVEPARARHWAAELSAKLDPEWELRAEAYHKALSHIPSLDYGALTGSRGGTLTTVDQSDFVASANGVAYGAGARAVWARSRARFELGYDWSVSERTFPSRFDGERQAAPWAEPHRWTLFGRVPLTSGWSFDSEAVAVRGRSWGLRRAYYDFLAFHDQQGLPVVGVPGADVLPTLYRWDAGVSWLGRVRSAPAEFRLEVLNLQSRQILEYSLNADPGQPEGFQRTPRLLPGRSLVLSLRFLL